MESDRPKVKIILDGANNGFGHQLEGMIRLLSLSINKKAEYVYGYPKKYVFEHSNFQYGKLLKYISDALEFISQGQKPVQTSCKLISNENRDFDTIIKNDSNYVETLYMYDGIGSGSALPPNFEYNSELKRSLPTLRDAFVIYNKTLPKPTYNKMYTNVVVHIRLGDAVGTRILDNKRICDIIKYYQAYNGRYAITIHSDGDIGDLAYANTFLHGRETDVLQVLSDFIHADILVINYSGLSIAAHLLADEAQIVLIPDRAGPTFKHRVLDKSITCSDFLNDA
jgi:hypothetical protein